MTTSTHKVALVTGTSTGIGLSTAISLAKNGWRVIATMRNLAKADRLTEAASAAGVDLDVQQLDVTDQASIDAAFAYVDATYGRLDGLVNNAGAATLGTLEMAPLDDVRGAMEVNFFGVIAVTKAAMPALRASHGHVLTVTSVGGVVGQPFNESYCAAKFAVEGYMEALHPVAATVGVRVAMIEPGAVSSEFVANAGVDPEKMVAEAGPYGPVLGAYLARTMSQFSSSNAQHPDAVGDQIAELLAHESPALRQQTSDWAKAFVGAKLTDLDGSAITNMTAQWVTKH